MCLLRLRFFKSRKLSDWASVLQGRAQAALDLLTLLSQPTEWLGRERGFINVDTVIGSVLGVGRLPEAMQIGRCLAAASAQPLEIRVCHPKKGHVGTCSLGQSL